MEAYKQEKFEVMQRARAYGITMMVGTQDECDIAFFDFKKKLDSFEDMTFEAGAASRDAEVVSLTNQRDYEYVRAENAEQERDQLREQVTLLRTLVPKRIPNGFVSFGKYYSEQEDKFNNSYNQMCKFKRKYLSDCEEALAATADLKDVILCEKAPIGSVSLVVAPDVYWGGKLYEANPSSYLGAAFYKSVIHGEPLYRAWEPKK